MLDSIIGTPKIITSFSDDDLAFFRDLILRKRAEAEDELNFHQSALESLVENEDDGYSSSTHHMADAASNAEEIDMYYRLIERNRQYIHQLDKALMRIDNGTYGICKVTGKPIDRERLIAVPHTRYSIAAKMKGLDKQLYSSG